MTSSLDSYFDGDGDECLVAHKTALMTKLFFSGLTGTFFFVQYKCPRGECLDAVTSFHLAPSPRSPSPLLNPPQPALVAASPVVTAAVVPESSPPSIAMGAAPPSESHVAASTVAAAAPSAAAPAVGAGLDNGSFGKAPAAKVVVLSRSNCLRLGDARFLRRSGAAGTSHRRPF